MIIPDDIVKIAIVLLLHGLTISNVTGSGKTYTMQPLPLRACQDILDLMLHPMYRNEDLQLWLSFFEIYGGKLYDLLTERRLVYDNGIE